MSMILEAGRTGAAAIMNRVERFFSDAAQRIEYSKQEIARLNQSLADLRAKLGKAWDKEAELSALKERYEDVSRQLRQAHPSDAHDGDVLYSLSHGAHQLAREPMENDEQSALFAHARQVLVKHLGQKLANRILLVRGDNPSVHGKHNPKTGQTMLFPEYIGAVRDADGNVVMSADEHLLAVAWHELLHRGATVVGRSADGQPLERGGKAQSCPHLGAKHQSTIRKIRQNLDG